VCASIYQSNPTSKQYEATYPWTRQMYLELMRHHLKYDMLMIGPFNALTQSGYFAGHWQYLNGYTPQGSQPSGFVPQLCLYETAMATLTGPASQIGTSPLQFQLAHDLQYDPEMRYVQWAMYHQHQFAGASFGNIYNLCMIRDDSGNASGAANIYGYYQWAGQLPGRGDGTDGLAVNQFWGGNAANTSAPNSTGVCQDLVNVNPSGLAYQQWAAASNQAPPPAPTPPAPAPAKRWFSGMHWTNRRSLRRGA
jgi:hypothetical protein